MEPLTLTAILIAITSITMDKALDKLSASTLESLEAFQEKFKKLRRDDPKTDAALVLIENSNSKLPTGETIEIIAESLEKELIKDEKLAKDLQEKSEQIFEKINTESPELSQEIDMQIQNILKKISEIHEKVQNIAINAANADFIGRDNALFAGVPTTYNQYNQHFYYHREYEDIKNTTDNSKDNQENIGTNQVKMDYRSRTFDEDIKNIFDQIARTRSGITKLIPVEIRLLNLEELRKPKLLVNYNTVLNIIIIIEKIWLELLSFIFIGRRRIGIINSIKNLFNQAQDSKDKNLLTNIDEDLTDLQNIESNLHTVIKLRKEFDLQKLKLDLNRVNDRVNVRIGIINDLFISLLYPASSSKELVANMVTRIGHKELREEAEMHLSVISGLVIRLNKLVEKFNIEKLIDNNDQKLDQEKYQNSENILKTVIDNLDEESLKKYTGMIKDIANPRKDKINDNKEKKEKEFYILSDEAQAAVGIMTEIEQRRLVVENLVSSDRSKQSITIFIVIFYIAGIISFTFFSYLKFGSNSIFIVGDDLNKTKLAFLGIPWPVVLWSLIGSFAAMIYRFNRQPIYNFTDAIKWMLTRPVQGIVLGSAFYLVLVSGLFLLGGNSTDKSSNAGKVTTEIILVLSFLVGFSDRFADTVFNALVDKYSSKESDKKDQKDNE